MKKTIKELYNIAKENNKPLLMSANLSAYYPTIIDSDGVESTANFIDDYILHHDYYDKHTKFFYGSRIYENDEMTSNYIYPRWIEECDSIVMMHLDSWARIYHSLSLQWNPLWNVDGTEKEIYSDMETLNEYGLDKSTSSFGTDKNTNVYGTDKTSNVIASRTNGVSEFDVTYEDSNEHQTSRTSQSIGGGTDTSTRDSRTDTSTRDAHTDTITRDERTDTSTIKEHTITKIRGGNIGVTETTTLLQHTWEFYQKNFFEMVIKTIIEESGCDYE